MIWVGRGGGGGVREGLRFEEDRNMSCHARVGNDDDEFEFLDSGSVYGTSSICFSFLCDRQLCFMLFVFVIK